MSLSFITAIELGEERWNESSDTRTQALSRLDAMLKNRLGIQKVPPTFWAFCQVADVSQLELLITYTASIENDKIAELVLSPIIYDCRGIVDRWLGNTSTSISSSSASSFVKRSATASNNCKKRDLYKCVLTKSGPPDAVHIYPSSLLRAIGQEPEAVKRLWGILGVFWEKDRVERWKSVVFGGGQDATTPQDDCFNMISLNKMAHALWDAGQFALRPLSISESNKSLKVQFFWQQSSSDGVTELDLLTRPVSSRGLFSNGEYSLAAITGLVDNEKPCYEPIESGDVFEITTADPENLPLPSWELLELQWYLQRIAGMSGAAEVGNSGYDDDADGTGSCMAAVSRTKGINQWLGELPKNRKNRP